MESDYLKLSEQYASFLAAVGGVSITVLALVLSFGPTSVEKRPGSEPVEVDSRAFLVAALVVATVSCFIGAHMMAETAAFISHSKGALSGERLFLLASTNIFIAIILVLFAVMLLLTTSSRVDTSSIRPISVSVFGLVVLGAIIWLGLAGNYRMPAPSGWWAIFSPAIIGGMLWGTALCFFLISKRYLKWTAFKSITQKFALNEEKSRNKYLLWAISIPSIIFTVTLLLYFAWTFNDGGKVHDGDIRFFSTAIIFSYVSLIVASIKTMRASGQSTSNVEENKHNPNNS